MLMRGLLVFVWLLCVGCSVVLVVVLCCVVLCRVVLFYDLMYVVCVVGAYIVCVGVCGVCMLLCFVVVSGLLVFVWLLCVGCSVVLV